MTDPYKAASKHNTKIRKIERWYAERIAAITKDRDEQLAAAAAELTPEIRAVIAAVEASKQNGSAPPSVPDLESDIPPALRQAPPPVPPGGVVVVEDKQKRGR